MKNTSKRQCKARKAVARRPVLAQPADPAKLLTRNSGERALALRGSDGLAQLPAGISKDEMRLRERAHPTCLGSAAYLCLSDHVPLPADLAEAAAPATITFLEEMGPRDALERLALSQVLLAHGRTAWLTKSLTAQTSPDMFRVLSEACEHAAGTFVRLMRAFAEYRRPANNGTNVSIAQANVAKQQVIQTFITEEVSRENHDEQSRITQQQPVISPALPANPKRALLLAACGSSKPTVGMEHGAKNNGRKAPRRHERFKARRTVSRRSRTEKAGKGNDSKPQD
jgi:hypothetical protein